MVASGHTTVTLSWNSLGGQYENVTAVLGGMGGFSEEQDIDTDTEGTAIFDHLGAGQSYTLNVNGYSIDKAMETSLYGPVGVATGITAFSNLDILKLYSL